MRLYSVAIASLAVGAPEKWTDNLLSHHTITGIRARARGVARGISWPGLVQIALVHELHLAVNCGVREAVAFAAALLRAPGEPLEIGSHLSIVLDRERFEHDLRLRLAEALETAPRPRRGRPPRQGRLPG